VTPAVNDANITDPGVVTAAIARVFEQLGHRPKRVALAVPDSIAKVSLMRFDKVPPRTDDFDQLVRWQMRKSAPFKMEEAQVSWIPGPIDADGGHEFVVLAARRDIVREYEAVVEAAGAHAGIVDLTTFNVINMALAASDAPAGDWLLVHVTSDYASICIVRGGALVFFRNRSSAGEGSLADLVHQTAMYYQDRLSGSGFARVVLAGGGLLGSQTDRADGEDLNGLDGLTADGHHADQIRRALEERLDTEIESIDPRGVAAVMDRILATPELLDTLAPLVGLVVRERVA
jgi:Tfp pilus assembly PilM family ATPase